MSKELERRSYSFNINAGENEKGHIITGRPIVYNSRTNLGLFDEIIEPGALAKTDLTDVRFLVNHDTSKIPLARSRRNNGSSTMRLIPDEKGLAIEVQLDTENNADARALYSAVQRGDISGMSFLFGVSKGGDEWADINSNHPTRHVRSISTVVEVSAVTFPAYESTEIYARSEKMLEDVRSTLNDARQQTTDELELLKEKTKILAGEFRYNHNHDSKGRFSSGGGGGGSSSGGSGSSGGTPARIGDNGEPGHTGPLKSYEKKSLEQGNTYEFAHQLRKRFPKLSEENGFTEEKAINSYQAYTDFNDGIFTFRGKQAKHFFDTDMRYRGAKNN